ncbi:glycosyltransferase [Hyphomicrobium sp. CS1BSMeth3]|uniref:glycosyltransferase n=1 Tax=Hyphomicrobium sp. CS1BSMeth3 TaxID=1892844 RepID=UPI0009FAEC05|nr:glycosyltransferase [Hyphomicrobium sp. CS1BSMeth3]
MSKRPAVIITGLPWIRSGTGKVMQAQVEYFKSLGWVTIFVACPFKRTDAYSRKIWKRFEEEKVDLDADFTAIASFWWRVSKPSITRRLWGRWHGQNAMHWALEPGRAASIPHTLMSVAKEFDIRLVLANHVYTFPVAQKLRTRWSSKAPIALVTHDIQSHVLLDNVEINPFTGQLDGSDVLLDTELRTLAGADYLIHVSSDDEEFFRSCLPSIPHKLVLPTIDSSFKGSDHGEEAPFSDFIFVGAGHIANYHALQWLLNDVWPLIDPDLRIKIVGPVKDLMSKRNPTLYATFQEFFTGSVPDVSQCYRGSRCVLAPMVTGRGVSIKTIEACAFGLPLVGTSFAYRGLPKLEVEAAGLRMYDEPEAFAEAARRAVDTPAPFQEASKRLYRRLFSGEAYASSMSQVLEHLGLSD